MSIGLLHNVAGFIGMGCVLLAYFMANTSRWETTSRIFHATNLVGALLIIVSLMHDWNLPIFVLEAAWSVIATYGLLRAKAWR